jgi:hypothetical protein
MDHYTVQGIDVPRIISEAKDPVVEFHFCTGFNSTPLVYAPHFELMNKLGISVFASKLLQAEELGTDDPEELINFQLASTRDFFTSDRVREHNKDIPKVGGAHSAAGGYATHHTTEFNALVAMTHNFRGGMLYIAPFFDTANGSKRFYPKGHKIFTTVANWNKTSLTSDTIIGKGHSTFQRKIKKEPQVFSADKEPTYGEILALTNIGDITIDRLENSETQPLLRQRFALPTKDSASCSKTGGYVADLSGAEKTGYDAHHNPQLETQENADRVTARIAKMGHNASSASITEYTKPKPVESALKIG